MLNIELSDLNCQRLKGDSAIKAQKHQAFYLVSTFSGGFKNIGRIDASYLVLSLGKKNLKPLDIECPKGFIAKLKNSPLEVCQSINKQLLMVSNKLDFKWVVYNQVNAKARLLDRSQEFRIGFGDWLFLVPTSSVQ